MTEKVTVRELRQASNLLFDYLDKCVHHSIELDADYYWIITEKERYDPYNEPKDLGLGQLYDDWQKMQEIAEGSSEPIAYHLVWLSAILTYVGERIVK